MCVCDAAFAIFLEDVYAAELATRAVKGRPDQYMVTVSIFVPKGRDKNRGDPVHGVDPKRGRANEYDFEASTQTEQIAWVNHICAAVRGITVEERTLDGRAPSPTIAQRTPGPWRSTMD